MFNTELYISKILLWERANKNRHQYTPLLVVAGQEKKHKLTDNLYNIFI